MWQPSNISSRCESRGEVSATSTGTTAVDNSGNTKGTWADLGAVTSFAYEAITVCIGFASNGDNNFMCDIGVSDGSNRYVLAADLYFAGDRLGNEQDFSIYIPVHVATGAQLSFRLSSSVAFGDADCVVIGHGSGLGGAPGFSRCVALFTPASSRGIAIDPGATANTKGAWTQMTSSCPEDIGAMFGFIGYNGDIGRAASATALIDIGIGAASSEYVLYPNAGLSWGINKDGPSNCPRIPLFACNVSKTTRIAARGACSLNTAGDRTFDLALYGLVR